MPALDPEVLAEIKPAHFGIVDDVVLAALHQDLAGIDDVGPVGQSEGLAHIVVGNEDADAAGGQTPNQPLNLDHRLGIDARERLVEQHVIRPAGERAGDLHAAALPARQGDRRASCDGA